MRTKLNTYRTYSSGKLELVRNNLDKDFSKIEKKIEELEDKKDNVENKIARINSIVEQNVEKKIGKKPNENSDREDYFILSLAFLISCLFSLNTIGLSV